MRIAIYNQPYGSGIGGAEYCTAVLAEALTTKHDVEIVHHHDVFTAEQLNRMFAVHLNGTRFRQTPVNLDWHTSGISFRGRLRRAREWNAELSRGCDLFINITHITPPFCWADAGILYVLFPFTRANGASQVNGSASLYKRLKSQVGRVYHGWEWNHRMQSYTVKAAISEYSREWTHRWWGIDSTVIYPPVDTQFCGEEKHNTILTVGRFVPMKGQAALSEAFLDLSSRAPRDWRLECVGNPAKEEYVARVREIAKRGAIDIVEGADKPALKSRFERAKLFWHAAGHEIDELEEPARLEHFGIVTVEAMAAGCVPVVINKGGQKEIVEHGVSGFLWNSFDELKEYSLLLMQDDGLREKMSCAARERSCQFTKERFVSAFQQAIQRMT